MWGVAFIVYCYVLLTENLFLIQIEDDYYEIAIEIFQLVRLLWFLCVYSNLSNFRLTRSRKQSSILVKLKCG